MIFLSLQNVQAEEDKPEITYIRIEPFIITNYPKKNGRYGFINVEPSLIVDSKEAVLQVQDHMPMIKDFFIFLFGSYDEDTITDYTQRDQIRKQATDGLKKRFTEEVGKPIVKDVIFVKYITQ